MKKVQHASVNWVTKLFSIFSYLSNLSNGLAFLLQAILNFEICCSLFGFDAFFAV
jgi:hypothetical protein